MLALRVTTSTVMCVSGTQRMQRPAGQAHDEAQCQRASSVSGTGAMTDTSPRSVLNPDAWGGERPGTANDDGDEGVQE
jgi:hypothetical protein